MNPRNVPVLFPLALGIAASLVSGAWIIAACDGWRVLWALWPLTFSLTFFSQLVNHMRPENVPGANARRQEPD